ncbi:MAG: UDP-N-acetylmuramoyl-tripeptide--D-alanyl-D-alanine ligase [Pedosphaera sp.]|nr:UDP-N-acetylmuramoyl-tripeptide--D-alanyl-D-alanine ligase [Pedosphaera sp.]
MDSRSLKFVASACAGEQLIGSLETVVKQVCTDSRLVQAGDLFFALAGERFDGHEFLAQVAEKGVAAVVVDRTRAPATLPCAVIGVDNPRQALGRLAARYRAEFSLPVIAVAGSNGKTTTKELLAAVLRQKFETLWSEASFNNDIGVPLTLLKLQKSHRVAVLEVGTNHPGELAPLVRMVRPGLGVITSIGREHLEFFGDIAGVAEEEGWLAELMPVGGKLFGNGDDEWTRRVSKRSRATVVAVGFREENDWRVGPVALDEQGATFQVNAPTARFSGEYRINLVGRHQIVNAMFAVAIGAELGLSKSEIQKGLAECKPAKMRLESWNWNGVCVLNDAYNANADSVLAALQTLSEMPCGGRRVAVLGDMAELGAHTPAAHEEVGRKAAELGLDQLFAVGKMAGVTAEAARSAGMKAVVEFADMTATTEEVKRFLKTGDVILLKASRASRLERLAEALKPPGASWKV